VQGPGRLEAQVTKSGFGHQVLAFMDEPWILPPPESIVGDYISAAFRAARVESPRAHIVSFSLPLCHQLLASGGFIALLPLSMTQFGKHLPIKVLQLASPKLSHPVGILTLRNRMLSPLADLFMGCAREIAKPLATRS
jgi:DNA-binding transcriptional LysR family regulator